MNGGPTQGASEGRAWAASPRLAFGLRAAAVVVPFVVAWGAIRVAGPHLFRPDGWAGLALWVVQAALIGVATSLTVERVTRRVLPLAALCNMSLVFPDRAPSRFGTALRSGTVKQLRRRVDEFTTDGLGASEAEAATNAVHLINLIGAHDRLTRGHTERVRAYADLIAEELGLSADDRNKLAWAALLHDVGKLAVPPEILNKQSRPNDAEWAVLQRHPDAAIHVLEPLAPWLGPWIGAVAEHHERWDGKGYPRGLEGRDISLAGRIVAVADAYDVITSRRSYKKPVSPAAARQELVDCAGAQFDPDVVRAFLNVSVGRRWSTGPLAWILDLPGVAAVASATPTVPALLTAAAVSVGTLTATTPTSDEPLALDAPAALTATTIPGSSTSGATSSSPLPSLPASTDAPPSTTSETTSDVEAPSSPDVGATASTTTSTPTSAPTSAPTTSNDPAEWAADDAAAGNNRANLSVRVLDNDEPPSVLDPETLRVIEAPAHGSADPFVPNGNPTRAHIDYRADDGFVGTDTFVYEICTVSGACASATVTMTIVAA